MKDPIVEEVRKNREKHAEEGFNFDLDLIYKDFKQKEQKSGRMTVVRTPKLNLKKSA